MQQKLPFQYSRIFDIASEQEFNELALDLFYFQARENEVYAQFLEYLDISPDSVKQIKDIPFMPISFFKTHKVLVKGMEAETVFLSSGTGQQQRSKHYLPDINLYEQSFVKTLEQFYGPVDSYCLLALLPSYIQQGDSSLVYMVQKLIEKTGHPNSGFYMDNYEELASTLQKMEEAKQPTILLGVSYALLDFAADYPMHLKSTIVMETGGMKGRRKEMVKEELHKQLCDGFGLDAIHSEYGMTELLSQAYSTGSNLFSTSPWMRILVRDTGDPFRFCQAGKTGGINVIDLANIYSCAFIATQDLGKMHPGEKFEVMGRFDHSDVRGCNLLVD